MFEGIRLHWPVLARVLRTLILNVANTFLALNSAFTARSTSK